MFIRQNTQTSIADTSSGGSTPPPSAPETPSSFLATPPAAPTPAAAAPAQAAPTNPYPKEDWRHDLPDDIRNDDSIKILNDVHTLAKSYVHARKAIGAEKVALPSKHSTPDDIQKFYDQLGRPTLDKYEVAPPKDAKFVKPEILSKLKPIAHKAGIMPDQLQEILNFYEQDTAAEMTAMQTAQDQQIQQGITQLKEKWGTAFDQRATWAKKLFAENGSPELAKFLDENKAVGSNAMLIEFAAKVGEMIYKEDTIRSGGNESVLLDPTQALVKANNILADAKHPYNDNTHPNHAAAVREVKELFEQAHPEVPHGS
jgi:hypothetical protein